MAGGPDREANAPVKSEPTRFETYVYGIAGAGFLLEVITGFGPKLSAGQVAGWPLYTHMLAAPVFIVGMVLVAIVRAERCRLGHTGPPAAGAPNMAEKLIFWAGLILGLVTVLSMLAAMLPVFGYAKQEALIDVHRISGLLLLIAVVAYVFVSLATRRAKR
jgi:hypothetical protein